MFNFYRKMPDFNPVAAGSKASLALPTGGTYYNLTLRYTESGTPVTEANMIAAIETVTLKVNGKDRYSISGKNLVALNKYYGNGFNNGELIIDLARAWTRTPEAETNLAWGTRNVDTLTLEVKIASGRVSPALSCDAWVTPDSRDLGIIVEIHEFSHASATSGKFEVPSLPRGNGDLVAIHMDNANITNVEVKLNGTFFVEDDTDLAAYHNSLSRIGERSPQTGYTHIDAMVRNRISDVWPLAGVQDFRVNPTLSSAGSVPIVMETLSAPLGLPKAA